MPNISNKQSQHFLNEKNTSHKCTVEVYAWHFHGYMKYMSEMYYV
jgi:hypothetical protein